MVELPRRMTMAAAINSGFHEAMAANDKVVVLGEDVADPAGGVYKTSKGLSTRFGDVRVRSTPIAEDAIAGTAVGLALSGYRPVAEIMFIDFSMHAMDQILNHAAKTRYLSAGGSTAPVLISTFVGNTHFGAMHSQSLEAWYMHTPGINVVMPSNPVDAKGLLLSCLESPDPSIFIQPVSLLFTAKADVDPGYFTVPLGKASIVSPGRDVTIVTYGTQVKLVLEAATELAEEGIDIEIIDLRSLVPMDLDTVLESVEKTKRCVVVHDAVRFLGPGAELAAIIQEECFGDLLAPVLRLGGAFTPSPFAKSLNRLPTRESIVASVEKMMGGA
jgi:pyruvate/2-oxoglutarate/acetoin dehydrogenase E1 component